jgi:hypothetical protein
MQREISFLFDVVVEGYEPGATAASCKHEGTHWQKAKASIPRMVK